MSNDGKLHSRVPYIRPTEDGRYEARVTQGDGKFHVLGLYTTRALAQAAIEEQWNGD